MALLFPLLLLTPPLDAATADADRGDAHLRHGRAEVRLLTVGNSFSRNATRHLGDLAASAGKVLIHHAAVVGGATLQLHLEKARVHERAPGDPRGLYATKRSLRQELVLEPWDYVTIQQASLRSHDPATYRPFAAQLHAYIKTHAPRAEVLLHQTWAYRVDDPRFDPAATRAPGEPATRDAMHEGLTRAYESVAAELGIRMIPVGDAFHLADTHPTWGYRPDRSFDPAQARHPALPDQTHSLHVGWRWIKGDSDRFVLRMDGHHAGLAGEYLGACVFYEMLFEDTPVGLTFIPEGLDPAHARFLQETAHRAVIGRRPAAVSPAPAAAR